jgi:hypothetical protein
MKRIISLTFILTVLAGCTGTLPPSSPTIAPTQVTYAVPILEESTGNVYDPDPDHMWNRVFRQFYNRTTKDGKEYGLGELDPLLWQDTTYLLKGTSNKQAIQVLDEFLTTHAENLIEDPLKRAMFQRDLWAVFDWLVSQSLSYPFQSAALKSRLAQIIKRVALTKEQIASLPDNYALAVQSNTFPAAFQEDDPKAPFLPADLFQPVSAWVPMGREGGPIAMTHTDAFPFFGRSVFLVFVRSPDGRRATLDFIDTLNARSNPVTPIGTEIALVRRMLLIDDQGDLTLSPLVESIQIRHFRPAQSFHEFELNREHLFDGFAGGLDLKTVVFPLFMSHGDPFEYDMPGLPLTIPQQCSGCHFEYPPIPNSGNTLSIISYSRQPFSLPNNEQPILFATTLINESETVIVWKMNHRTWKRLKSLWKE